MTLCKSFIRPHLGYGEVVYDQSNNDTFCGKHEFILSNAALAITAEIKGSFRESDLLNDCLAFTTSKHNLPQYLVEVIPVEVCQKNAQLSNNVATHHCRADTFKYSFFLFAIKE